MSIGMMRYITPNPLTFILFVLCMIPVRLEAQSTDEVSSGYVDFSEFEDRFGTEASLEVDIRGQMLQLVAEASREEDPELAELLDRLDAIQVRGFPMLRSQFRRMESHSRDIAERLEVDGWNTVVKLRDYGQYVDVYAKENDRHIEGLMMMVVDTELGETVLINIVGSMQAEELGRIGNRFDIAPLEEVMSDQ